MSSFHPHIGAADDVPQHCTDAQDIGFYCGMCHDLVHRMGCNDGKASSLGEQAKKSINERAVIYRSANHG